MLPFPVAFWAAVTAERQAQVAGAQYANETAAIQAQVPGGSYMNEGGT